MFLKSISFDTDGHDTIAPNDAKAPDIYARIGYRLEEAVADLVDNSIDANASRVLIRFIRSPMGGIHSMLVADDGDGMNDATLREAMRFGADTGKKSSSLGKYGIGLKSASLSQARSVTVISRQNQHAIGRRWTTENIRKGYVCERLKETQCAAFMENSLGAMLPKSDGTIVLWEDLEHLKASADNVNKVLERTKRRLRDELGLKFHRLLESKRVEIFIDELELALQAEDEQPSLALPVQPLDPFSYENSGSSAYPKVISLPITGKQSLDINLHVWPPNSKVPGYKLGGGKVASRQGFYFYRNDRLIQAGGWNGLNADESEPHMSLARVSIDLPASLDSLFKLDIGKSMIDPPLAFQTGLDAGAAATIFKRYLKDADAAYRKQKKKESAKFPFVIGAGVAAPLRKKVKEALREPGLPQPREVAFKWSALPVGELVNVNAHDKEVTLNKRYRAELTTAGYDGATLKLLLLLVFQEDLSRINVTESSKDRSRRINQALLAAMPG